MPPDQPGWYLTLTLDEQGTRVFAALTTQLAALQPPKNELAIVVGGQVAAAPSAMHHRRGRQKRPKPWPPRSPDNRR